MATINSLDLSSKSWQDIFSTYRISDIQVLSRQLKSQADAKKQDLRDLVGGRYRDLLKTADTITDMKKVVVLEDSTLSELSGIHHYSKWNQDEINVNKFLRSDKQSHLQKTAIDRLYRAVVQLINRELNLRKGESSKNLSLIARSLFLAKLLSNEISRGSNNLTSLTNQCLEKIEGELLKSSNISSRSSSSSSSVSSSSSSSSFSSSSSDLFIAYMITSQSSPNQLLQNFLNSRENFITKLLEKKDSTSLVEALSLASSTLFVAHQSFAQNQLHRLAAQQANVYTILDSPEFATNDISSYNEELGFDKVRKWLPKSIVESQCLPDNCTKDIQGNGKPTDKSRENFKKIECSFVNNVVRIFSTTINAILDRMDDLSELVKLYNNILELLLRDSRIFIQDSATNEDETIISWFNGEFQTDWNNRFKHILREKVIGLGKAAKECAYATNDIIINGSTPPNYLLLTSITDISLNEESLPTIFKRLNDFSKGYHGDVIDFSQYCVEWSDTISKLREQVDVFAKLKSLEEYDGDDESEWKSKGVEKITRSINEFQCIILDETNDVYVSILNYLEDLAKSEKANSRSLSFVIKCVAVIRDTVGKKINEDEKEQDKLQLFLVEVYDRLSKELILEFVKGSEYGYNELSGAFELWEDVNGISIPKSPSSGILALLARIAYSVGEVIGKDDIIWEHEESRLIREAFCRSIIEGIEGFEESFKKILKDNMNGEEGKVEELEVDKDKVEEEEGPEKKVGDEKEKETIEQSKVQKKEDQENKEKKEVQEKDEQVKAEQENVENKEAQGKEEQEKLEEIKAQDESSHINTDKTISEYQGDVVADKSGEVEKLQESTNQSEEQETSEASNSTPSLSSPNSQTISSTKAITQLFADRTYIQLLFGVPPNGSDSDSKFLTDPAISELIKTAMKDMVSRTYLMYSPII